MGLVRPRRGVSCFGLELPKVAMHKDLGGKRRWRWLKKVDGCLPEAR